MGDYLELAGALAGLGVAIAAVIGSLAIAIKIMVNALSKREEEHEDTLRRLSEAERRQTETEANCRKMVSALEDKWRADNHALQVENLKLLGHIKDLECRIIELEHENHRRRERQEAAETASGDLRTLVEDQRKVISNQEQMINELRSDNQRLRDQVKATAIAATAEEPDNHEDKTEDDLSAK